MNIYHHRQKANLMISVLGIASLVCFIFAALLPVAFIFLFVGTVLLICLVIFSSLTVEVSEDYLSWHFGLGLMRKLILLSDIESVEVTQTKLIEGWGIRFTSRGWLYNVSGFQAVAITLKTGKQFLLGSDEPERLASVLRHSHLISRSQEALDRAKKI